MYECHRHETSPLVKRVMIASTIRCFNSVVLSCSSNWSLWHRDRAKTSGDNFVIGRFESPAKTRDSSLDERMCNVVSAFARTFTRKSPQNGIGQISRKQIMIREKSGGVVVCTNDWRSYRRCH
jgi:hypothetical protein